VSSAGNVSRTLYRRPSNSMEIGLWSPTTPGLRSLLSTPDVAIGLNASAILGISSIDLLGSDEPITTLAPSTPGRYADALRAGEQGMRTGQYASASEQFATANMIAKHNPGPMLSLVHAHCALGNYALMSHYISQTLINFPEMPLVRIRLRGFFQSTSDFIELRQALRNKVLAIPTDANLWLSLAYLEWFDDNVVEAAEALRKAAQTSTKPSVAEAVETFWQGCVASGKVQGGLMPTGMFFGPTPQLSGPPEPLSAEPPEQPDKHADAVIQQE